MIRRLLIANRGEVAVRIAQTARSMGIVPVGVAALDDLRSPHVAACDVTVELVAGPSSPYLAVDQLIAAAHRTEADAVHPGYGFLAESAEFAARCIEEGLTWVGPSPAAISAMGDKIAAKDLARRAGVPTLESVTIVPDSSDDQHLLAVTDASLTYPLLVKPAAGGGGKGMHVVEHPDALRATLATATREAQAAFGDGRLFVERYLSEVHHVEIQVLGDQHGNLVHLAERECSIQRRHQKVVEEAPSPRVDQVLRASLADAALTLAREVSYVGAGTVEFLVHDDGFAFLEMNTRLQVEHPVTEEVLGVDLVELQVRVAQGEPLSLAQASISTSGHAIEVRLYAEDPARGFMPSPGEIDLADFPPLDGIRYEVGVRSGSMVGYSYDPMLAKIVARGDTRAEAIGRLTTALRRIRLHGVVTNRDYLVSILESERFRSGRTTTAFLDEVDGLTQREEIFDRRLVAIGVVSELHRRSSASPVQRTIPVAWRNVRSQPLLEVYELAGEEIEVRATPVAEWTWNVNIGDVTNHVELHEVDGECILASCDGLVQVVWVRRGIAGLHVDCAEGGVLLHERTVLDEAGDSANVGGPVAPVPGSVVAVAVRVGDRVEAGDLLVVMEAMKMEHRIEAQEAGVVAGVSVESGQRVDAHQLLIRIDPREDNT